LGTIKIKTMKRLITFFIGLMLVTTLSAQNDYKYQINALGGVRIGPTATANKAVITSATLSGTTVSLYNGATQYSVGVAAADQIDGFTVYARKFLTDTLLVTDATYTLALADAGRVIYCDRATWQEITIPANVTIALPIGTVITFIKTGAGPVGVLPAATVIRKSVLDSTWMNTVNQTYQIVKRATNKWYYIGNWVD
jgi:hypothetical protein